MKITVKTFASLKGILGFSEKIFDLPENITAGNTIIILKKEYPDFNAYEGLLLVACNEEFCSEDALLKENDILALFPPVSGG